VVRADGKPVFESEFYTLAGLWAMQYAPDARIVTVRVDEQPTSKGD
jgi:hypothetical protein